MIVLSYDLLEVVFNNLCAISQIRFRQLCDLTYDNLQITNFYDIQLLSYKITNKILEQYQHITRLNLEYVETVSDVNYLTNLRDLNIGDCCGVDQTGISELRNVIRLNAENNDRITNVNHLPHLRVLNASRLCGIDQVGISESRNLVALDASYNDCIYNLNHCSKLRTLYINSHICAVDQPGISKLRNLTKLSSRGNDKITQQITNTETSLGPQHGI